MIINYFGNESFELKDRQSVVITGEKIKINDFVIEGPGEYEISGIDVEVINGITIFRMGDMTVGYLNKRKKDLDNQEVERVNGIDILLISISGGKAFTPQEALDIISQIEPKIVIPISSKKEDIKEFCQQEGVCSIPQEKFKVSKGDLPQEERQTVILEPRYKSE